MNINKFTAISVLIALAISFIAYKGFGFIKIIVLFIFFFVAIVSNAILNKKYVTSQDTSNPDGKFSEGFLSSLILFIAIGLLSLIVMVMFAASSSKYTYRAYFLCILAFLIVNTILVFYERKKIKTMNGALLGYLLSLIPIIYFLTF